MKTTKMKLIIGMSLIIVFSSNLFAQSLERRIKDTVYKFDSITKTVENKNNWYVPKDYRKEGCMVTVYQDTPIEDCYKKVFSKERAKELENGAISLYCTCDSLGTILQIRFTLWRDSYTKVSLSEIKKLEDVCLGYRFRFLRSPQCTGEEYYMIGGLSCRFKDLYNDEKK